MIKRSMEGTSGGLGGFNLMAPLRNLTVSCFLRDRPSTELWWAKIAAPYTFQGRGCQPTFQLTLQESKHYSNRAPSGVFLARKTADREQTPTQGKSSPHREGSGLSESVFLKFWTPGMGGPRRHNRQDLFLTLVDLAKGLCEKAHWGNRKVA